MARASSRAGFYSLSGSTNRNRTVSAEAPKNPKNRDEWVDSSVTPSPQYYYSATYTEWRLISNTTYKKKASNESVTSSTTVQNDNDIVFSLQSNSVYEIELQASASSASNTPDIKLTWAVTGGVSQLTARTCAGVSIDTTDHTAATLRFSRHDLSTSVPYGVSSSGSCLITEKFLVQTTTAGTLTLKWAQYVSDGTAVTLSTSTFALCKKIT